MNLRLILFVVALLVIAWIILDHKRKTRKHNCYIDNKRDKQHSKMPAQISRGLAYDIEPEVMTNNHGSSDFSSSDLGFSQEDNNEDSNK